MQQQDGIFSSTEVIGYPANDVTYKNYKNTYYQTLAEFSFGIYQERAGIAEYADGYL